MHARTPSAEQTCEMVREGYGDAYLTAHFEVPGEMFTLAMQASCGLVYEKRGGWTMKRWDDGWDVEPNRAVNHKGILETRVGPQ
jgi:hypothetical protein